MKSLLFYVTLIFLLILPTVYSQNGFVLLSNDGMQAMDSELLVAFYKNHPELKEKITYIQTEPEIPKKGRKADVWIVNSDFYIYKCIKEKGCILKEWKEIGYTPLVLVVAQGNPEGITKWEDLTRIEWGCSNPEDTINGKASLYVIMKMLGNDGLRAALLHWHEVGDEVINIDFQSLSAIPLTESRCIELSKSGKSLYWVFPLEGTIKQNFGVALLTDNPSAKLFYEFLSTEEAQHILAKYGIRPKYLNLENTSFRNYPYEDYILLSENYTGYEKVSMYFTEMFDQLRMDVAYMFAGIAALAVVAALLMLRTAYKGAGGLGSWILFGGASTMIAIFAINEALYYYAIRYSPKEIYIQICTVSAGIALFVASILVLMGARDLYEYSKEFIMGR